MLLYMYDFIDLKNYFIVNLLNFEEKNGFFPRLLSTQRSQQFGMPNLDIS